MAFASEVETIAPAGLDGHIALAHAVWRLAPDREDEAARIALIQLGLRRFAQSGRGRRSACDDCLDAALARVMPRGAAAIKHITEDEARVLALVLMAYAGDLSDPTEEADLVFAHDDKGALPEQAQPISLLGNYVFFSSGCSD